MSERPDPACILVLRNDLALYASPHPLTQEQIKQLAGELAMSLPGMRFVIVENAHFIDARPDEHRTTRYES